jgi:hypothetical protein
MTRTMITRRMIRMKLRSHDDATNLDMLLQMRPSTAARSKIDPLCRAKQKAVSLKLRLDPKYFENPKLFQLNKQLRGIRSYLKY